jgi:hypothetical protein
MIFVYVALLTYPIMSMVAGNQKKFKSALKKFLYTYSFYTIEEYLSQL